MDVDREAGGGTGSARRREGSDRAYLKYARMSVAMALAECSHHSAPRGQRMARAREEDPEVHFTATVRTTDPLPEPELFDLFEEPCRVRPHLLVEPQGGASLGGTAPGLRRVLDFPVALRVAADRVRRHGSSSAPMIMQWALRSLRSWWSRLRLSLVFPVTASHSELWSGPRPLRSSVVFMMTVFHSELWCRSTHFDDIPLSQVMEEPVQDRASGFHVTPEFESPEELDARVDRVLAQCERWTFEHPWLLEEALVAEVDDDDGCVEASGPCECADSSRLGTAGNGWGVQVRSSCEQTAPTG